MAKTTLQNVTPGPIVFNTKKGGSFKLPARSAAEVDLEDLLDHELKYHLDRRELIKGPAGESKPETPPDDARTTRSGSKGGNR